MILICLIILTLSLLTVLIILKMLYDFNHIILTGDFNTSFSRDNAQSKCLSEFLVRNNLFVSWEHPSAKGVTHIIIYRWGIIRVLIIFLSVKTYLIA